MRGACPQYVQQQLGHETLSTTLGYNAHIVSRLTTTRLRAVGQSDGSALNRCRTWASQARLPPAPVRSRAADADEPPATARTQRGHDRFHIPSKLAPAVKQIKRRRAVPHNKPADHSGGKDE